MNSLSRVCDQITDVVARQLNYFDHPIAVQPWESYEDILRRIDDNVHIERYRNDPVFHAKVRSLVARVMTVISENQMGERK